MKIAGKKASYRAASPLLASPLHMQLLSPQSLHVHAHTQIQYIHSRAHTENATRSRRITAPGAGVWSARRRIDSAPPPRPPRRHLARAKRGDAGSLSLSIRLPSSLSSRSSTGQIIQRGGREERDQTEESASANLRTYTRADKGARSHVRVRRLAPTCLAPLYYQAVLNRKCSCLAHIYVPRKISARYSRMCVYKEKFLPRRDMGSHFSKE